MKSGLLETIRRNFRAVAGTALIVGLGAAATLLPAGGNDQAPDTDSISRELSESELDHLYANRDGKAVFLSPGNRKGGGMGGRIVADTAQVKEAIEILRENGVDIMRDHDARQLKVGLEAARDSASVNLSKGPG
jgi:hypothetical protein